MAKLPSYHLTKKGEKWRLEQAGRDRAIKTFDRKQDALRRDVLREAVGKGGGSVKIHKENGRIQQERTYPTSRDPRSSKG